MQKKQDIILSGNCVHYLHAKTNLYYFTVLQLAGDHEHLEFSILHVYHDAFQEYHKFKHCTFQNARYP